MCVFIRLGYRMGMCAVLALWVCWDCVWGLVSNGNSTIGGRAAFPVFRACGGILLLQWFWAVSVFIWNRYRVNYIYLFDFNPRIIATPLGLIENAVDNSLVFLILMLLYYKVRSDGVISPLFSSFLRLPQTDFIFPSSQIKVRCTRYSNGDPRRRLSVYFGTLHNIQLDIPFSNPNSHVESYSESRHGPFALAYFLPGLRRRYIYQFCKSISRYRLDGLLGFYRIVYAFRRSRCRHELWLVQ
jgi:hypothetical protein